MATRINVGDVTAYASAVQGGFEGSYGDFCTHMANLSSILPADTTLTQSGKAADAKATGDEVRSLFGAFMEESITGESIVTFVDGANLPAAQVVAEIVPNQPNLYDGVWIGGNGKNLLPVQGTSSVVSGISYQFRDDGTVRTTGTATTSGNVYRNYGHVVLPAGTYILNGCPEGGGDSTYRIRLGKSSWGGTALVADKGDGVTFTLSEETDVYARIYVLQAAGQVDMVFKPMIRKSDETDDAYVPYQNICPITGYSSLSVSRIGKNSLNPALTSGLPGMNEEGTVELRDTDIISTQHYGFTDKLPFDTDYHIYAKTNNLTKFQRFAIALYSKNGYYIENIVDWVYLDVDPYDNILHLADFPDIPDGAYFRVVVADEYGNQTASVGDTIAGDFLIQRYGDNVAGSNDTSYDPYSKTDFTVSFPSEAAGTVGGTISISDEGVATLTVTHGAIDIGTLDWEYYGSGGVDFFTPFGPPDGAASVNGFSSIRCSAYNTAESGLMDDNTIRYGYFMGGVGHAGYTIRADRFNGDAAALKTSLSGVIATYVLAVPVTYTIPAPQVYTAFGQNSLWSSCEDYIFVRYRANTGVFIERRLAVVLSQIAALQSYIDKVSAMTAFRNEGWYSQKNIFTDDLIVIDGDLYKAQQNIPIDVDLRNYIGTGLLQTTVDAQLKLIQ